MSQVARTRRLLALYAAQERASEARLQGAAADLSHASNLLDDCVESQRASGRQRRNALVLGDSDEQAIEQSLLNAGSLYAGRLQVGMAALACARDDAESAHRASRMEAAQVEQLADRTIQEVEQQTARRDQLDSDDRFAARRNWREPQRMTER